MPAKATKVKARRKPKRVNLGPRLVAWRKRRSKELGVLFTQDMAAEELGINPSTYIQYENQRRGSGMSEFQYDHIIAKTARNGTKAKESPAVESPV